MRVGGRVAELTFGILIVEDLIAIVLLATLGALAAGGGLGVETIGLTLVRLGTFLAGLLAAGLLLVPRTMRRVVALGRDETTLVAAVGLCFGVALLALAFGYSVALGAFVAGSLVAESGESERVEALVGPVRDVFVAIFFVSVGMLLDPTVVAAHWRTILLFTALVMAGKALFASAGAFLAGAGLRTAVQTGLSLAQIGEFSFLIASLGVAAGARAELFTIAVAVSAITTLATPMLVQRASGVAAWVDRKLPHRLQTFAALYGTWLARLRTASPAEPPRRRRLVRRLVLDSALLAVIILGAFAERGRFAPLVHGWVDLAPERGEQLVLLGALALTLPVVITMFLTARHLAGDLALQALPQPARGVDAARAPRRALTATVHLGLTTLALAVPLLLLQPMLPRYSTPVIVAAFLLLLVGAVWTAARDLEGHARAGAEVIATALAQELGRNTVEHDLTRTMERMVVMLPGLGEPVRRSHARRGGSARRHGRDRARAHHGCRGGAAVVRADGDRPARGGRHPRGGRRAGCARARARDDRGRDRAAPADRAPRVPGDPAVRGTLTPHGASATRHASRHASWHASAGNRRARSAVRRT